ncbi:MAG: hypothetical protein HYY84_20335 [Deltaproteobacteria bacterium]|nr:hypothetical protein [Deltaproteobacteria bacterium]
MNSKTDRRQIGFCVAAVSVLVALPLGCASSEDCGPGSNLTTLDTNTDGGTVRVCVPDPDANVQPDAGGPPTRPPDVDSGSDCLTGFTRCGGTCVALSSNTSHCGACNNACTNGQACNRGVCDRPVDCRQQGCANDHYCDLATGRCNPGCATDTQCPTLGRCDIATHRCVCNASDGLAFCNGLCVREGATGCGASCRACPSSPRGGATCNAGACGETCYAGFFKCGAACCAATKISAGGSTACVVTSAGGVVCWGRNEFSGFAAGIAEVAAGRAWHSCARNMGGGVTCWGDNRYGELGDGTTTARSTPVVVSGLASGATALGVGDFFSCAATSSGGLKCWGRNSDGQLGDGTSTARRTPVDVTGLASGVTAVAAGENHTCAIAIGGGLKCWGDNDFGAIGDGTFTTRYSPVNVTGFSTGAKSLSAGNNHTCAVTTEGAAKCWGLNMGGQLGRGATSPDYVATPAGVLGLDAGVKAVTAGGYHTCALTEFGAVHCWGNNENGQVGTVNSNTTIPNQVENLASGVTAIATGRDFSCALMQSGRVKCWGINREGQLGNGFSGDNSASPVDVVLP